MLDRNGGGYTTDVLEAIGYAIRNKARLGIDVINLSLGHPIFESAQTDPLVQMVEKATRAGIIVVVAAGNYGMDPATRKVGYGGITSPENAPSAITVGAIRTKGSIERSDDRVADYSSRGPTWYDAFQKPDLVAPGDRIVSNIAKQSSLYRNYPDWIVYSITNFPHFRLSGSSMATGVTSGVVALMIEARRAAAVQQACTISSVTGAFLDSGCVTLPAPLSANLAKAILQYTAIKASADGAEYDALTQGAGSLNAEGALRLAASIRSRRHRLGHQRASGRGEPIMVKQLSVAIGDAEPLLAHLHRLHSPGKRFQ